MQPGPGRYDAVSLQSPGRLECYLTILHNPEDSDSHGSECWCNSVDSLTVMSVVRKGQGRQGIPA